MNDDDDADTAIAVIDHIAQHIAQHIAHYGLIKDHEIKVLDGMMCVVIYHQYPDDVLGTVTNQLGTELAECISRITHLPDGALLIADGNKLCTCQR